MRGSQLAQLTNLNLTISTNHTPIGLLSGLREAELGTVRASAVVSAEYRNFIRYSSSLNDAISNLVREKQTAKYATHLMYKRKICLKFQDIMKLV